MAYNEGMQTAAMAEKSVYRDKYASLPEANVETAFSTLSGALDRSNLLASRVEQLADRLVGAVPTQAASGTEGHAGPRAVFPALSVAAAQTRVMVEDALIALDRIERELP